MMTPDNWDAYEGNDFSVPRHLLADIYRIVLNSLIWDILFSLINNVSAKSLHLCLILCDPMDYGLPGSSVHGDSPGKNTGIGCHGFLQGIFLTQGSNPGLPHCRRFFTVWATRKALIYSDYLTLAANFYVALAYSSLHLLGNSSLRVSWDAVSQAGILKNAHQIKQLFTFRLWLYF